MANNARKKQSSSTPTKSARAMVQQKPDLSVTEYAYLVEKLQLGLGLAKIALETEQLNHRRSRNTLEAKESEVRRMEGQRREDLRELLNLRALVAAQKKEILQLYKSEDESRGLRKECSHLAHTLKKREKTLHTVKLLVDEFEPKVEQQALELSQLKETVALSHECKVCLTEAPLLVLVPCGHTICGDCRPHVKGVCHLCRAVIRESIQLHL